MTKEEILKSEYGKLITNPDKAYMQNPSLVKTHKAIPNAIIVTDLNIEKFLDTAYNTGISHVAKLIEAKKELFANVGYRDFPEMKKLIDWELSDLLNQLQTIK